MRYIPSFIPHPQPSPWKPQKHRDIATLPQQPWHLKPADTNKYPCFRNKFIRQRQRIPQNRKNRSAPRNRPPSLDLRMMTTDKARRGDQRGRGTWTRVKIRKARKQELDRLNSDDINMKYMPVIRAVFALSPPTRTMSFGHERSFALLRPYLRSSLAERKGRRKPAQKEAPTRGVEASNLFTYCIKSRISIGCLWVITRRNAGENAGLAGPNGDQEEEQCMKRLERELPRPAHNIGLPRLAGFRRAAYNCK